MNKDKLQEVKQEIEEQKEETKQQPRQIIIETDGNTVNIVKAEVAGKLEMLAILQQVIAHISK